MVGYPPPQPQPHPQHFVRLLWRVFGTHLHTWAWGWIRACKSQGFSPWPGCFNPGSPSYQLSDNCISMTLKCCLTKFYGQVKVVVYCKDAHQFSRVGRHWRGYTNKEDVKGCEPQTVENKNYWYAKKFLISILLQIILKSQLVLPKLLKLLKQVCLQDCFNLISYV